MSQRGIGPDDVRDRVTSALFQVLAGEPGRVAPHSQTVLLEMEQLSVGGQRFQKTQAGVQAEAITKALCDPKLVMLQNWNPTANTSARCSSQ